MKLLFRILLLFSALLVVLLIAGMMLPARLQVESEVTIKTTVDKVYQQLIDYRLMTSWLKTDSGTVYRYEGPATGVGTIMHWTGKKSDADKGSQKIIEAELNKYVKNIIALNGMPRAYSLFTLEEKDRQTVLNWRFDTHFGFNIPARVKGLFMSDVIEQRYQRSLLNLKALLEE